MRTATWTMVACSALGLGSPRLAVAAWVGAPRPAASGAATGGNPNASTPGEPTAGPTLLLEAADAAVTSAATAADDAGAAVADRLRLARQLYERVLREFPQTPEAALARRALNIMTARDRMGDAGPLHLPPAITPGAGQPELNSAAPRPTPGTSDDIVVRREPYSRRTSERLRLTSWEKLDFGVTSFLYGMSVGTTFAVSTEGSGGSVSTLPVAVGALAYTLGAVAYLNFANPDRGDLPLALAITSYVPLTVMLATHLLVDNPDAQKVGLSVAAASVVAVPVAIAVSQKLNLDPGDTQLVRDAGFWGATLAFLGTLGFGGRTQEIFPGFSTYEEPSGRALAGYTLLGLYGGLGLGVLAASNSEVSLERVRVTTWGGYGGGLLGGLVGAGLDSSNEAATFKGVAIGALAGLVITFLSTGRLDGIPAEDQGGQSPFASRWTPAMVPITGVRGQPQAGFGLAYALR